MLIKCFGMRRKVYFCLVFFSCVAFMKVGRLPCDVFVFLVPFSCLERDVEKGLSVCLCVMNDLCLRLVLRSLSLWHLCVCHCAFLIFATTSYP